MQDDWRRGSTAEALPSRAMNVGMTQAEVTALCRKHDAAISSIETLHSGGTRVVLKNNTGAEAMRKAFGTKLITTQIPPAPRVRNG